MSNILGLESFLNKFYKKDDFKIEISYYNEKEGLCYFVSYDENGEETSRIKKRFIFDNKSNLWSCSTDDFDF